MDVSKLWVDITLMSVEDHTKQPVTGERFDNDAAGMKALHIWLMKHKVSFDENSLLVIENTGVYHRLVWEYCSTHGLPLHIGNATHIKYSFGIACGKNDKIDSRRLCTYAFKNADELKATPVLNPVFLRLKDMMTARNRLVAQQNSIKVYLGEQKLFNSKETQQLIEQAHQPALEGLKQSLKTIGEQIKQMIQQDSAIKSNYELLLSVPDIGHLTAVYIICCTNNFVCKITGINKDYADSVNYAFNWFGTSLSYDYGFSSSQLNSNIAGLKWRDNSDDKRRAYGFTYDAANRLTKADYTQGTGSTPAWNTTAGLDFSVHSISYDLNGNILTINQGGKSEYRFTD